MNPRQKRLFLALFIWQTIYVKWSVNGQKAAYSSSHFYFEHTHSVMWRALERVSGSFTVLSLGAPRFYPRLPSLVCPPVFCTLTPSLQLKPIPVALPSLPLLPLFVPLLLSSPSLPVVLRPLSLTLPDSSFKRRNRAPAWATAMQSNKPCLKPNYCWDVFIYIPSLHLPFFAAPIFTHPSVHCLYECTLSQGIGKVWVMQ